MSFDRSEYDIVERHFASIYLTVIALIQGIALSVLATTLLNDLHGISEIYYERYIMVAITIFVTWHHYMYGIIYLRWFPWIMDTLLPLSIGGCQFIIAGSIKDNDPKLWLMFLSAFYLFGGLAYINAAIRTRKSLFSTQFGEDNAGIYCGRIQRCHGTAGIFSILQSGLIAAIALSLIDYNFVYTVITLSFIHIVAYEAYYLMKIKPFYLSIYQTIT